MREGERACESERAARDGGEVRDRKIGWESGEEVQSSLERSSWL